MVVQSRHPHLLTGAAQLAGVQKNSTVKEERRGGGGDGSEKGGVSG